MPISSGVTGSGTGWTAASAGIFDATGLIPPTVKLAKGINLKAITGEQLFQVLSNVAQSGDPAWGNIRYQLVKAGAYSKNPNFNINWGSDDISAVQTSLTSLFNSNAVSDVKKPVSNFLMDTAKFVKNNGISTGVKAPTTVPATADLVNIAQTAFQKTLMRDATPEEAQKFAKQFQDMVLAYGDGKTTTKQAKPFATPSAPIAFEGAPVTPMAPTKTASTPVPQPVTSDVAAQNFASNQNKTESSATAAANGLNEFLGMLKG